MNTYPFTIIFTIIKEPKLVVVEKRVRRLLTVFNFGSDAELGYRFPEILIFPTVITKK